MEESYGVGYATRASEMGYGERYGEAVKAVLDKNGDKREMQRGATSDRDQEADACNFPHPLKCALFPFVLYLLHFTPTVAVKYLTSVVLQCNNPKYNTVRFETRLRLTV